MTKMTEITIVDLYIALEKVKTRQDRLIMSEVDDPSIFDERAKFIEMVEANNIVIKHIKDEIQRRRAANSMKEFVWMGSWE